jgi:hypothetical protein
MKTHETIPAARTTFRIAQWDEEPIHEATGEPKLTRVHAKKAYAGDVEGEGTVEYLMMYRGDGTATFVGLERFVGRVGERRGSFVLEHAGAYVGGRARSRWLVVAGSGTRDLAGAAGKGELDVGHDAQHAIELALRFE